MKDNPLLQICIRSDEEHSVALTELECLKPYVRAASDSGTTPLHFVALGKNVQLAAWLIENGATFEKNEEAETPLHWACKTSCPIMISLFVNSMTKSEINQKDIEGRTALDWAVEYKTDATADILEILKPHSTQKPKKSGSKILKLLR